MWKGSCPVGCRHQSGVPPSHSSRPLELFRHLACRRSTYRQAGGRLIDLWSPQACTEATAETESFQPTSHSILLPISTSLYLVPCQTSERSRRVLMRSLMQLIQCQHLHSGLHSPTIRYTRSSMSIPNPSEIPGKIHRSLNASRRHGKPPDRRLSY